MIRLVGAVVVAATLGIGCVPSRPSVVTDVPGVLAVVEVEAYGDRPARAAAARRRAPWGASDRPSGNVIFLHELRRTGPGAWTIARALPEMVSHFDTDTAWLLVAPADAPIDVRVLADVTRGRDGSEPAFIGRALRDVAPTPIHHYAEPGLAYPDPTCGFLLSRALAERLATRWSREPPAREMSIDASYELARWIADDGPRLVDVPGLCGGSSSAEGDSRPPLDPASVVFAVRTHAGNHRTRLPIISRTWGPSAKRLVYYSDVEDPTIPTVATGVPNVERGHCEKLRAVLRMLDRDHGDVAWAVLTDDDTLVDVPGMLARLARIDPAGEETVFVGRRYGVRHRVATGGYDFLTLGAGVAVTRAGIRRVVRSDCRCSAPDAPDDMWLGACLARLGIEVVHDEAFHQQQPAAYPAMSLRRTRPLTFHRFEPADPVTVFDRYLRR